MRATLVIAAGLLMIVAPAAAQVPAQLPLSGTLLDGAGAPIEGDVNLEVSWYDAESATVPLLTTTRTVRVEGGLLRADLGEGAPVDLAPFHDCRALFVGIRVNGGAEMSPRLPVTTTPYAALADHAGDAEMLGGRGVSALAPASRSYAWSDVVDVPPDWADGDDDALPTAGAGVSVTGGTVAADTTVVESWARAACFDDVAELRSALDATYAPAGSGGIPSGAVAFFDGAACPTGWSALTTAEGRALVAVAPGGGVGVAVGAPLADGEARLHTHAAGPSTLTTAAAGDHTHVFDPDPLAVQDNVHRHHVASLTEIYASSYNDADTSVTVINWDNGMDAAGSGYNPLSSDGTSTFLYTDPHTHGHTLDLAAATSTLAGAHTHDLTLPAVTSSAASATMPYVQRLVCRRD